MSDESKKRSIKDRVKFHIPSAFIGVTVGATVTHFFTVKHMRVRFPTPLMQEVREFGNVAIQLTAYRRNRRPRTS